MLILKYLSIHTDLVFSLNKSCLAIIAADKILIKSPMIWVSYEYSKNEKNSTSHMIPVTANIFEHTQNLKKKIRKFIK